MLIINYSKMLHELLPTQYNLVLNNLPPAIIEKNMSYRKWEDRHLNLIGVLLLLDSIKQIGYNKSLLALMKYDQYGKPYINNEINFNISHSGNYVICAISDDTKLGIDIEQIKPINFIEFNHTMTQKQWDVIKSSEVPTEMFFKYWSMKESVIKADSRGLSIPLKEILITDNIAMCFNEKWHLFELNIDRHYISYLATDILCKNIVPNYINYY